MKNFFRSTNTENKEKVNKIEAVKITETETLVNTNNSLDDDIPVEAIESSSVKKDIQDYVDETNNAEDVDDKKNFIDEKQMVLKKSLQRSNSLNASNKIHINSNFISNSLVKFSKNHSDSKMQDKNKT